MNAALRNFQQECLRVPDLTECWNALARHALDTYSHGLPLALQQQHGEQISDDDLQAYRKQKALFEAAASDIARVCAEHGIDVPQLRVEEISALSR